MCNLLHAIIACNLLQAINCTCNHGLTLTICAPNVDCLWILKFSYVTRLHITQRDLALWPFHVDCSWHLVLLHLLNVLVLPSATARPHLWCVVVAALAARPRTRAVQNRGVNVQSASRQRDIWGLLSLTCQVGELCGQQVPAAESSRPSNCLLLTAVPFQLPQLESGTVCQKPSSHRHHYRLSAISWKLIFFNVHTLTWFFDRLTGI